MPRSKKRFRIRQWGCNSLDVLTPAGAVALVIINERRGQVTREMWALARLYGSAEKALRLLKGAR